MRTQIIVVACVLLCSCGALGGAPGDDRVLFSDNFTDPATYITQWERMYANEYSAIKDGVMLCRTGGSGVFCRKAIPSDFIVQVNAKCEWRGESPKEKWGMPGFNILLRGNKDEKGPSFYNIFFCYWQRGGGEILIKKIAPGASSKKWEAMQKWDAEMGRSYDIRVAMEGKTITVWVDGIEKVSVEMKGDPLPAGKVGLGARVSRKTAYFDEFRIMKLE